MSQSSKLSRRSSRGMPIAASTSAVRLDGHVEDSQAGDPTSRIKVGERTARIITPLTTEQVDAGVEVAATPAERLILALAAVHAARSAQICRLQLDDVDLGNRRLTIDGRTRPLDELTYQLLTEWMDYRRRRWPNTANPHLIINQMSAMKTTTPASTLPLRRTLRGRGVIMEALRIDRQLVEEAITIGRDPLHLAEVFGLSEKTAIRYAETAKTLLPKPPRTPGRRTHRQPDLQHRT